MPRTRTQSVPKKRKRETYDEQRPRQQDALEEYLRQAAVPEKERLSLAQIAEKHDVRVGTLKEHVAHGVVDVEKLRKPGRGFALSRVFECMLAVWVMAQQALGCAVFGVDVRERAARLQKVQAGKPAEEAEKPKDCHWLSGFMQRFPFLSFRHATPLPTDRAQAANPFVIRVFFSIFSKLLQTFNFGTIWNMDESYIDLKKRTSKHKVIGIKGSKNAHRPSSNFSQHITIIACVSNHGDKIPPMLIFPGKKMDAEFIKGAPPGTKIIMSDKGWSSDLIFAEWMKHFVEHTNRFAGLKLLLLDGHGSHFAAAALDYAVKHGTHILVFPSHCTHVLQPLDVGIFHNFKQTLQKAVEKHMMNAREVSKSTIAQLVAEAWESSLTTANILSGFRDSGIWPVNPDKVLQSGKLSPSLSLSTSGQQPIVLPEFSKKHRAAVEQTIKDAGQAHLVHQPLMGIVLAAVDEANKLETQVVEPATIPAGATIQSSSSAPAPAPPRSVQSEIAFAAGGESGVQRLQRTIDSWDLPPKLVQELKEAKEQLVREAAAAVLQHSNRATKPASEKTKKKTLRGSGQTMALTEDEILARITREEEEAKSKQRKPRKAKDPAQPAAKRQKTAAKPQQSQPPTAQPPAITNATPAAPFVVNITPEQLMQWMAASAMVGGSPGVQSLTPPQQAPR
jgi:hypothetical protein